MSILTDNSIRQKCVLPATFRRGKTLFQEDAVFSLLMKKVSADSVQLIGDVEGSGGNLYQTSVRLEMWGDFGPLRIGEGRCDCKAFAEYNGFCKHLVATLLETDYCVEEQEVLDLLRNGSDGQSFDVLQERVETKMPEYDDEDDRERTLDRYLGELLEKELVTKGMPQSAQITASGRTFSDVSPVTQKESSRELLDAISGVVLQQRNRFCQELAGGDVELEVTLYLERESEKLGLRIGRSQMYVVKDIEKLVEDIRGQQFVQYGKNLEFVHTQSAFTKEALSVVSFLLNVSFPKTDYFHYRVTDRRYLELDAAQLQELLSLYAGEKLLVQTYMERMKKKIPVRQQDPFLPITIQGTDNGNSVSIVFPEILLLEGVKNFSIWWDDCIYICSEEFCREMKELVKLMTVYKPQAYRTVESRYSFYSAQDTDFHLSKRDYASFCATLLPIMEKYADVRIEDMDFSVYQIEEPEFVLYLDMTEQCEVVCQAKAVYGEREHNLIRLASLQETYRDVRMEYELRTLVEQYFPEKTDDREQYLLRGDDDRLAALVEYGVEELRNLADVFISEAFKRIRVTAAVHVTTGLSVKGNLLNVQWDISGMSKEELYDILSAYRGRKKYFRLKNGELLNLAESGIGVFADLQENLHLSKAQLKAGMAEVPLYRSLYLEALMKENADKIRVSRDDMFRRIISSFDAHKKYVLPDGLNAHLREYQTEGYQWACSLAELGFGGILADDMGLGKTLQMIAYLCSVKGPVHLVVCPASLVYNWEAEFQRFAPNLRIGLVVGNAQERRELLAEWQYYDVLVTSYDLLKRDIDFYAGKRFGCEIIDEAQYIKNPSTQAAKAVKSVESRNRFALTGTPIENRLSELWSIFEYLMPGYLYSYKYFKETFEQNIVEGTKEEKEALDKLHAMTAPFLLRRLKKDVLKDLPDKVEKVVYTRFGREQDRLYRAAEKNIVMNLKKKSGKEIQENKLQILAELTRLRQLCCDPALLYDNYKGGSAKIDTCMEVLENAIEGGHRVLLFSQFTSMLDLLVLRLKERGIPFLMLTGSTGKAKRRDLVEQFQNGKGKVFLISLKAGGTGLNLTAADLVIHYDPWWNVAAQNQATDRTHRIGQSNDVTVVKLIAQGTIEERILKLQEMKQDLADKIISADGVSLSGLSKEELLGLFD